MDQSIEFLKAVQENNDLQAAVKKAMEGASDIDAEVAAVTDVAVKAGFNVSPEALKATVLQAKKAAGELSDDDLANVAGGAWLKDAWDGTLDFLNDAAYQVANFFSGW